MGESKRKLDVLGEASNVRQKNGRILLVSGAKYWDFKEQGAFRGIYQNEVIGPDPQDPEKKKIIGYTFTDTDGEDWVITSAYAVAKALETEIEGVMVKDKGVVLEIIWKEKLERAGKQPYNIFEISIIG